MEEKDFVKLLSPRISRIIISKSDEGKVLEVKALEKNGKIDLDSMNCLMH